MTINKDEWTHGTLEVHLSEKIKALHLLMDQRQKDSEKALDVALAAMNKRLEGMNEFRQSLSDQRIEDEKSRSHIQETFVVKEIYNLEHLTLENMVNKNADRIVEIDKKLFALSELKVDKREGLSSKYMYSAILFSVLSFIGLVVTIILNVNRR